MSAVWYRARSELRAGVGTVVALALIAGLAAAVVLALVAGARRTDDVYPRFLRAQRAADVLMVSSDYPTLPGRAARLPMVVDSAKFDGYDATTDVGIDASADGSWGGKVNRFRILEGRAFDPRRADEAVLSFTAAEKLGLGVGDSWRLRFEPDERGGAPLVVPMRIVGIEAAPGEFPPTLTFGATAHLSPAFARKYGAKLPHDSAVVMRLRHGEADIPAFNDAVQRLTGGRQAAFTVFMRDQTANVQRSFHLQAIALWLVAALFGVTVLLVVTQLLVRQAATAGDDNVRLAALGMTPLERLGSGGLRVGATAAGAAVIAVAGAVLLSPIFPLGVARKAETAPGLSADGVVLVLGGLVVFVAVIAVGAVARWRVTRSTSDEDVPARPSFAAAALRRRSAAPAAVIGVGMAFEPGRGRSSVPVRSTVFGATIAVAALTAALVFGGSLRHLLDTPRLYGWNWDVGFEGDANDVSRKVIPALLADDRVKSVGAMSSGLALRVNRTPTDVALMDRLKGDISPVILEGRAPRAAGEIMLGTVTLRKVGAHVGDRVDVAIPGVSPHTVPMKVVGRGVLPPATESARLGEGAIVSVKALAAPLIPPGLFDGDEGGFDSGALVFAPGADRKAVSADLQRVSPGIQLTGPEKPVDLVNFGRIESLPFVLAALLGTLAAMVLVHLLVSSVRRRRRDLAVLKALGLAPRQVRAAVAWQGSALVLASVALGIPLGLLGGRWVWSLFAHQLGVVAEPVTPLVAVALIVPGTVAIALLAGIVPGWLAARVRPALVLRTE